MNKGIIVLLIAILGVVGFFFVTYFRDRSGGEEPAPPPVEPAQTDHEESKPAPERRVPEPAWEPEEVTQSRGAAIEGQVIHAVTGAPVTAYEIKYAKRTARRTATRRGAAGWIRVEDAQGRFSLTGLSAGRGALMVRAAGFSSFTGERMEIRAGITVQDHTIRLEAASLIEGFVRSTGGTPVANAGIFLERLPAGKKRSAKPIARSDERGLFRYETDSLASLTFVARHPDFAPDFSEVQPQAGVTTELTIVLGAGAMVEGTILYGSKPLANQAVVFAPQFNDLGIRVSAITDSRGHYLMRQLMPCDAAVTVSLSEDSADGVRSREWNGLLENGQLVTVNFAFSEANSVIEGAILLDGAVPESASLSLLVMTDAGEEGRFVHMKADGTYRLESVPAGPVSLTVNAEDAAGRMGFDEGRFRIRPNQQRVTDFDIKSIAGTGKAAQ